MNILFSKHQYFLLDDNSVLVKNLPKSIEAMPIFIKEMPDTNIITICFNSNPIDEVYNFEEWQSHNKWHDRYVR